MNHRFTFIDLYAGIGGFRIALEKHGGKCLGFSEIDKEAVRVYKNNFVPEGSGEVEFGDVTKLNKLPEVDVLVGGVPCQSWSVAGKMRGFDDPRGRLWMDTIRLVELNSPKAFIFENVKGLMDPRNKANLDLILERFAALNYVTHHTLLNSSDFGLPQNRDRIYIVGIRADIATDTEFAFPNPVPSESRLHHFLDNVTSLGAPKQKLKPEELFGGKIPMGRNRYQRNDQMNDFFILCDTRDGHTTIHSWDIIDTTLTEKKVCMAILRNRRKKIYGTRDGNPIPVEKLRELVPGMTMGDIDSLVQKRILREVTRDAFEFVNSKNSSGIGGVYRIYLPESQIFSTLTATGTRDAVATESVVAKSPSEFKARFIEHIYKQGKYRRIHAHEAARLQGFPDEFKLHEKPHIAHKQFGNAVSVPVVYSVMHSILKTGALGSVPIWTNNGRRKSLQRPRIG